jgi:HD-GYP domain-containing protein (c-di-GMP phosphodiesterase class II)
MDVALHELQEGRGTRYDAKVVDACLGLLTSGRFAFN